MSHPLTIDLVEAAAGDIEAVVGDIEAPAAGGSEAKLDTAPLPDPILQHFVWWEKTKTWVCKLCVEQAARVVGSPVMEYRVVTLDHRPSGPQLRDMVVHKTYHDLGGNPPQYPDFAMHRERQLHGDAFMYACHQCNWKVGVTVALFDRCHSGLVELTRRIDEHRRQHQRRPTRRAQ